VAAKKNRQFDPNAFLAIVGEARKTLAVPKEQRNSSTRGMRQTLFSISKQAE
jgi:hypothetical protein